MVSLINKIALMAIALSSMASTAPTSTSASAAATGLENSLILSPVKQGSFTMPADIKRSPTQPDDLEPRASASASSNPKIILSPVKANAVAFAAPADAFAKRAAAVEKVTPKTNITLDYEAIDTTTVMLAQINATMKYPSVLLENIDSVSKVDCAASSVDVTFSDAVDFEESLTAWSASSSFILFTSHLGDCDTDNTRGLYIIDKLTSNKDTLTITATATKSTFQDATDEMDIAFTKPLASGKRAITSEFLADLPGTVSLSDKPTTKSLSISVEKPSLSGHLGVSGHMKYNFFKGKASKFYVDIDLGIEAAANVKVSAGIAYDNDVYSFSPPSLTISAFSIPGILDVGPMLEFGLGVELAVSGQVDISADLTASIPDGNIHLDFLESAKSSAIGWTPVYTHAVNVSATVDAQVNPYLSLTAAIGVNFLSGLLDLSAGIEAKPTIINEFSINGQFNIDNANNVTIPAATEDTCTNGLWFSSAFAFIVTGFVTQFYELEIYRLTIPIYETGCWSFATANAA